MIADVGVARPLPGVDQESAGATPHAPALSIVAWLGSRFIGLFTESAIAAAVRHWEQVQTQ